MFKINFLRNCILVASFSLLPLFLLSIESHANNSIEINKVQVNKDVLLKIIYIVGTLDDNPHSPIHQLKQAISQGIKIKDSDIISTIEYAQNFLQSYYHSEKAQPQNDLCAVLGNISGCSFITKNPTFDNVNVKNSLSVKDLFVSQCVKNLCVNKLSVTDAMAHNLHVENSLSFDYLSVADAVIDQTLSVNEIFNNSIHFVDATGTQHIELHAPTIVDSNYEISLPSTAPLGNQILRTNAIIPTNLEWVDVQTTIEPTVSKIIYVAQYGNDITGNGSADFPYASLSQAVNIANEIASTINPITIVINPGIYLENNSSGPIIITNAGISLVGSSLDSVIITPNTPNNDLFLINDTVRISDITFQSSAPFATAISLNKGQISTFDNVRIINFSVGIECNGLMSDFYHFNSCFFINNSSALVNNNASVQCDSCIILGNNALIDSAANRGIFVTGSSAKMVITGGMCQLCTTGFTISDNAFCTINSVIFRENIFDIVQDSGSHLVLSGSTFAVTEELSEIDVQIDGVGTRTEIIGCEFNGNNSLGTLHGIALSVTNNAIVDINNSSIRNYNIAIAIGLETDTSSTILTSSGVSIQNCVIDILHQGSATVNFNSGIASSSKIEVSDTENSSFSFFDLEKNSVLSIGSLVDKNTTLMQAALGDINNPQINYKSSLYSSQAIGLESNTNNALTWFVTSAGKSNLSAITTDRTKDAGIQLLSDSSIIMGDTNSLRGWTINKNGVDAQLSFNYQNSDIVDQIIIDPYTVMELDGINRQLNLPAANTHIVFAEDTHLYRSAAQVLKTDDNFVIGALTPGRVVITDNNTNELRSHAVTSTELGYISGLSSPIQTQLQEKVSKLGDTMVGTLELPAGTITQPALVFSGSATTGISANNNELSFSTNAQERIKINAIGNISFNGLTSPGIMHNNEFGVITSSLINNGDIVNGTITNDKLAEVSSNNSVDTLVIRDSNGNFATNMISLSGLAISPTDVVTKAYVDSAIAFSNNNNFVVEEYTIMQDDQTFNVASTTSVLLLSTDEDRNNFTIIFPASPINGQLFTIILVTEHSIEIINDGNINNGNPAHIIHGVTSLNADLTQAPSIGGSSVTYIYISATNSWYRYSRG